MISRCYKRRALGSVLLGVPKKRTYSRALPSLDLTLINLLTRPSKLRFANFKRMRRNMKRSLTGLIDI